ncbi:MAG: class I SAM-dependent methyltransferase [Thermoguttaceae bacterium]
MMNASPRRAWQLSVLLLAFFTLGVGLAYAQEKSVRPGINKQYDNPDINENVRILETENRDVFSNRKQIVAECKLKPGMAVADIGAGTGLFTRLFAAEVGPKGRVYAVDIAKNFIEHVEKTSKEAGLKNVTGIVCTPTSCELPPNSVDLAFICDTYHHFEYPQKTMASIHQALRPGGQLILVEYCRIEGKTPDWLLQHLRAGQEVFTKEIEADGFKVVDQPNFLKENYFVRFEKVEPPHKAWLENWQKKNSSTVPARTPRSGCWACCSPAGRPGATATASWPR